MLAIVVDKEQKRRDIALACKDVIIKSGVQEPTIATLAKSAGIGKGTFYEYFKSKDELLFELVHILMEEHNASLQ
ncbi:MAG TPA: TetR/AcrR family transcriptional regulator [Nitratifractor sp.]|nr:TetR/AcrR family transcriptional regulator [Nitratifractor sp.]